MVIHDQGQMPFPDNEGNDVLPSRSTSFAIRKVARDKRNEVLYSERRLRQAQLFFLRVVCPGRLIGN